MDAEGEIPAHHGLTHEGSIGLREYVGRARPRYLLHGHTYPDETHVITSYRDTEIVYVYQDRVVTIS
jgi:Icc-related predicted phosphoesterase